MSVNPGISTTDARAKGFETPSRKTQSSNTSASNTPRMIQPRQLTSSALRYKRVARGAALLQEWLQTIHDLEGTHFAGALYSAVGKYSRPLTEAGREK
ncbi:MAG TPA: hypothetical protein VK499_06410 [Propionibacteriaceae bacterium]|nr:hypothetical protein [Propionibacteriaceae bacterium]